MGRIIILIVMHAVGDFFLQSNRLNKLKALKKSLLLKHVGIYTSLFIVLSPLILGLTIVEGLYYSFLNGFLHLVVDYFTSKAKFKYTETSDSKYIIVVVIDHVIHISVLIASYMILFPKAMTAFASVFNY
jgi:hypothetical protein